MNKSREHRVRVRLPVRIWGMDFNGKLFEVRTHTVDITPQGACLESVPVPLPRGAIVGVESGHCRARFCVTWVGQAGTPRQGQIGIHCVEPGKYIWAVPLERGYVDYDADATLLQSLLEKKTG